MAFLPLITAAVTGFLSLGYEVLWNHLFAVVIGNTVYAFGIMLFSFLLGIAIGSYILLRYIKLRDIFAIAILQIALASSVLLVLPLWDKFPYVFAHLRFLSGNFILTEAFRFIVCFTAVIIPTLCMGATFPLLVKVYSRSVSKLGKSVGNIYFINTVASVAGALLVGYVLLPKEGSYQTSKILAMSTLLIGIVWLVLAIDRGRMLKYVLSGSLFVLFAVACVSMSGWDKTLLTSGTNIYFSYFLERGEVVFFREDPESGIITVENLRGMKTLRNNGKYEYDDESAPFAYRFMLYPILFTRNFDRASLIGLGGGATLGAMTSLPFKKVDVVELSPAVIEASKTYWAEATNFAFTNPNVSFHIQDGRNFLMLTEHKYDLICTDISNLFFSGAGNLYNKEFYEIAKSKLAPGGIFMHWFHIHHTIPETLLLIINTAHKVFQHMAVFVNGHQAFIVASDEPLHIDYNLIENFNQMTKLDKILSVVPLKKSFLSIG